MLREQHRLKKKQKKESWQYQLLMAVPRNMIYVFLCLVIAAFVGMIYVVYSEQNLKSFLESTHSHEKVVVHPLFQHFKMIIDEERYIKKEKVADLNSTYFFMNYVKKNIPCYVSDGCANWPAVEKWNNKEYLQNEFASQSLLVITLKRENTT